MSAPGKQIHLAAHFPGVNNSTVWSDPQAGSHIEFESFVHLARTAERAKFDFFFLAEGLRMREHAGRLHELDVAGRPDNLTVLAALASVTDRIGLMPTITTTYHEPHELARQLASLDHLSDGRAGWNLVPELQRRGVYRTEYDRGTLREKLFGRGPRLPSTHRGARHRRAPVASP
jgi:alkanesulfonate monooxygenase SsuD/methylene tetrahydromethanopterin reductase-like flavin-dependent oxidoreductase (luciferase family)